MLSIFFSVQIVGLVSIYLLFDDPEFSNMRHYPQILFVLILVVLFLIGFMGLRIFLGAKNYMRTESVIVNILELLIVIFSFTYFFNLSSENPFISFGLGAIKLSLIPKLVFSVLSLLLEAYFRKKEYLTPFDRYFKSELSSKYIENSQIHNIKISQDGFKWYVTYSIKYHKKQYITEVEKPVYVTNHLLQFNFNDLVILYDQDSGKTKTYSPILS